MHADSTFKHSHALFVFDSISGYNSTDVEMAMSEQQNRRDDGDDDSEQEDVEEEDSYMTDREEEN